MLALSDLQLHAALHAPWGSGAASLLFWSQAFTTWPLTKTRLMDLPFSATSTRFLADTTSILAACDQEAHVSNKQFSFPCLSTHESGILRA